VTTPPPDTLAYRPAADLPDGVSVARDADGVLTISVLPLPPRRRLWLGAVSVAAVFLGPAAAAVMLAAGMGWVGPLLILALLLAPAILLRLAVISLEHEPPDGPEVVFRLDAHDLEVTVRTRSGERIQRWPRQDVRAVRPGWVGSGLVVRPRGRSGPEVLPWHPLRVRSAVAGLLEAEILTSRAGAARGYNAGGDDAPVRPAARRRPGPFV
jgi:MFS family permease